MEVLSSSLRTFHRLGAANEKDLPTHDCKLILRFTSKSSRSLEGKSVARSVYADFLRVKLNQNIIFKENIWMVATKINKLRSGFYKITYFVLFHVLIKQYYSLLYNIKYCIKCSASKSLLMTVLGGIPEYLKNRAFFSKEHLKKIIFNFFTNKI